MASLIRRLLGKKIDDEQYYFQTIDLEYGQLASNEDLKSILEYELDLYKQLLVQRLGFGFTLIALVYGAIFTLGNIEQRTGAYLGVVIVVIAIIAYLDSKTVIKRKDDLDALRLYFNLIQERERVNLEKPKCD